MKPDYVAWAAVIIALVGSLWTVNTGFNGVHERVDRVNERLDRMQSAIATLDGRVSRIEGWTEGRFDAQSARDHVKARRRSVVVPG